MFNKKKSNIILKYQYLTKKILNFKEALEFSALGPELQCLLKVREDLSLVLGFQDAKNNVSN